MGKLFGTDGIRGVAGRDPITPEMGVSLGRAVVGFCEGKGIRPVVIIGRDTRASGEMLENAAVSGVLSAGGKACRAGVIPTPGVAYLTRSCGGGAGIVISASHNPYEYNGFKLFSNEGFKLSVDEEAEIEEMINSGPSRKYDNAPGQAEVLEAEVLEAEVLEAEVLDASTDRYLSFLEKMFPGEHHLNDMKIVLDCANGATFRVAPALFERLGASVETLFAHPDGKNINHHCGSQYTESIKAKVLETGADVGLAFDGDGDRLAAVDEKGALLTGDQLLTIYAKMLEERKELKNNVVVSTVMSNLGFRQALGKLGIEQIATKVGDRYVMEEMRSRGANLGGEDSGHIIFLDHHTTGDGLISALQVIRAIKTFKKPLSELSALMTVFPQTVVNVQVKRKPALSTVPDLVKAIEKVEKELGEKGRVLVRYSGTEPVCRIMVEGEKKKEIEDHARQIGDVVRMQLDEEGSGRKA